MEFEDPLIEFATLAPTDTRWHESEEDPHPDAVNERGISTFGSLGASFRRIAFRVANSVLVTRRPGPSPMAERNVHGGAVGPLASSGARARASPAVAWIVGRRNVLRREG